ncbi:hypothetical protein BDR03DRAFT_1011266 [Suillus americanus]|nr:hypothetical protein BDR03DRAFT_1011266 [Suillus americanus]
MTDQNPSEIKSLLMSYSDSLTDLELSLTCHWHDVPSIVLNPFAALTHLHISSDHTLDLFISFLRTFQILNFDSSDITSLNLKTIHLLQPSQHLVPIPHFSYSHKRKTRTRHPNGLPHSSCLLLAHQSPTRLNTLVLSPYRTSSITLTDADILTLVRTCLHLNILDLGSWNTTVSLHALNILIWRCRELRQVSLCVDAQVDALGDEGEVGLQPNARLITPEVGNSLVAYVGP